MFRMSGALLLEMRVDTSVYTSFQETTCRFSLMPGFSASNLSTKFVPFMPVPRNQSLVLGPYWQMMTSSVMSPLSANAQQDSASIRTRISAVSFFMGVPPIGLICYLNHYNTFPRHL